MRNSALSSLSVLFSGRSLPIKSNRKRQRHCNRLGRLKLHWTRQRPTLPTAKSMQRLRLQQIQLPMWMWICSPRTKLAKERTAQSNCKKGCRVSSIFCSNSCRRPGQQESQARWTGRCLRSRTRGTTAGAFSSARCQATDGCWCLRANAHSWSCSTLCDEMDAHDLE